MHIPAYVTVITAVVDCKPETDAKVLYGNLHFQNICRWHMEVISAFSCRTGLRLMILHAAPLSDCIMQQRKTSDP